MDAPNLLIHNFFDNAIVNDFARDYLFRVTEIKFDRQSTGGASQVDILNTKDDLIYAKSASLPGRNIVNQPVKYSGQTFNVPGSVEYPGSEGYEIEFYCPETSSVREKFMNESFRTFNSYSGEAGSGAGGGTIASRNSYIMLKTYNKNYQGLYNYKLVGCSVREVSDVAYQIAEGDGAVMTFKATIAYHFFERSLVGNQSSNNQGQIIQPYDYDKFQ